MNNLGTHAQFKARFTLHASDFSPTSSKYSQRQDCQRTAIKCWNTFWSQTKCSIFLRWWHDQLIMSAQDFLVQPSINSVITIESSFLPPTYNLQHKHTCNDRSGVWACIICTRPVKNTCNHYRALYTKSWVHIQLFWYNSLIFSPLMLFSSSTFLPKHSFSQNAQCLPHLIPWIISFHQSFALYFRNN